jgi:hypothetical protein
MSAILITIFLVSLEYRFKDFYMQRFAHEHSVWLFPLSSNQPHTQFDNHQLEVDKAFLHRIFLLIDWGMEPISSSQFSPSLGKLDHEVDDEDPFRLTA